MLIDTLKLTTFQFFNMGLGFALTLIYAKNLELVEFSKLSLFLVYSALAAQMLDMGSGNALLREYNLINSSIGKNRVLVNYVRITINKIIFIPILVGIISLTIGPDNLLLSSNLLFWTLLILSNYLANAVNNYYQATSLFSELTSILARNIILRTSSIFLLLAFEDGIKINLVVVIQTAILILPIVKWDSLIKYRHRLININLRKRTDFIISDNNYNSDISKFNLLSLFLNRIDYFVIKNFINMEMVGLYYVLQQFISPIAIIYNSINVRRSPDFFKKVGGYKSYINKSINIWILITIVMMIGFYILSTNLAYIIPFKYNYLIETGLYAIFFANAAGLLSLINIIHNKTGRLLIMNFQIVLVSITSISLLLITNGNIKNYFAGMSILNLALITIVYFKFIER